MVKLFCNRCGKECDRGYHTISIFAHNMEPTYCSVWGAAETAVISPTYSPIAELNRTKHYCPDCIREFENFLENKEDTTNASE